MAKKTRAPMKGHNSGVAGDQLRAFIERIERLAEEKATIAEDMRNVYAEAKGTGFDPKIIRKVVARRARDAAELAEEDAVLDLYLHALGMLPLFETGEGGGNAG